mgnify:CR=1 FL=1
MKENIQYKLINKLSGRDHFIDTTHVTQFLSTHLEEYGDKPEDITRAVEYIFEKEGGFVLIQLLNEEIAGIVVVNETGMTGYIPENILVYIALDKRYRGRGLGKALMQNAIKLCNGEIALHVEKDNPARFLYEKLGFTTPYLEMRLKQ